MPELGKQIVVEPAVPEPSVKLSSFVLGPQAAVNNLLGQFFGRVVASVGRGVGYLRTGVASASNLQGS